ncbi:MAG: hypothetical protein Q9163_004841 [Psora crenata]
MAIFDLWWHDKKDEYVSVWTEGWVMDKPSSYFMKARERLEEQHSRLEDTNCPSRILLRIPLLLGALYMLQSLDLDKDEIKPFDPFKQLVLYPLSRIIEFFQAALDNIDQGWAPTHPDEDDYNYRPKDTDFSDSEDDDSGVLDIAEKLAWQSLDPFLREIYELRTIRGLKTQRLENEEDRDTDSDSSSEGDRDTDSDSSSEEDRATDIDSSSEEDRDTDSDSSSEEDRDTDSDSSSVEDSDTDSDSSFEGDRDTDSDSSSEEDRDTDSDSCSEDSLSAAEIKDVRCWGCQEYENSSNLFKRAPVLGSYGRAIYQFADPRQDKGRHNNTPASSVISGQDSYQTQPSSWDDTKVQAFEDETEKFITAVRLLFKNGEYMYSSRGTKRRQTESPEDQDFAMDLPLRKKRKM